jgi:hypothetical protein
VEDEVNFLQGYLELNRGTEIPEDFAFWCGVAGISCVLGRNSYIDMGTYTIYPNFYILLVASSGRQRKSTAIGLVERLIRKVEPTPTIIAQKITPEALIDALRKPDLTDPSFLLRQMSTGFAIADEMANFINKHTYENGLGSLLIPLYDCKDSFEYRTKGSGSQQITNACLGMLCGSTVDWIRSGIPEDAVGGGLTSRFIFVYCDRPAPPVALTGFSDEKKALFEALIRSLQRISTIRGEFVAKRAAIEYYVEGYNSFYKGSDMYDNPTLSGYASRRWFHAWKLAMCFSACNDSSRVITLEQMQFADTKLKEMEAHLPLVMSLITSSESGSALSYVYLQIKKRGKLGISRSDLVRSVSHKMSVQDMNGHLAMLIESNRVTAVLNGQTYIYVTSE